MSKFTHFDETGVPHMVDVGSKPVTTRMAIAKGCVVMMPETLAMIENDTAKKGDVISVAQLAGIMGAKQTANLIPLCHPLGLDHVAVELTINHDRSAIDISATCRLSGQTGVEMEALTAVSVSALTIYDMCKSVDRGMYITDIRLTHKSGGKSGQYDAP
ncbi:cyclic pyranopterin monophosphate synthase MoaC [Candidatus Puniceispirillum sp.]|uniref:cyclic pyranopterin monophosphate synthase MoaC n=1 Tax=Candidatus Puniceispirillum sp. TaxID=2026719 RepID=UPI003F69BFD0